MADENGNGHVDDAGSEELDEQTTDIDMNKGSQSADAGGDGQAAETPYSKEEEDEAAEQAGEICSEILKYFPLQKRPVIRTRQDDQTIFVNIEGDGTGILIGRRGQTLEALQYIANRIASRKIKIRKRLEVDTEHYRARRKGQIVALARKAAEHVRDTGEPYYLEPMPASERRVIHLTLKDHPDLFTESEGSFSERRVIVKPRTRNGTD